MKEKKTENSGS